MKLLISRGNCSASYTFFIYNLGARVSAKNRGDDTPLHNAAQCGEIEVLQTLIKSKAQVNAQNEHGNSPLHYACFNNHISVARLLGKFIFAVIVCGYYETYF